MEGNLKVYHAQSADVAVGSRTIFSF